MPPDKRQLPPPPHQIALSFVVERLKVVVPPPALVLILLVVVPSAAVWTGLLPWPAGEEAPTPNPARPLVPLQKSTTDTAAGVQFLARVLPGTLPEPGPNQKRSGQCDPRQAQVEINGGCWVKTETPPPCPEGYQWLHKNACWLPVAHAKPLPTTGEPQAGNVAGEP